MKFPILNYRLEFKHHGQTVHVHNRFTNASYDIPYNIYKEIIQFDGKTDPRVIYRNYSQAKIDKVLNTLIKKKIILENQYYFRDDDGLKFNVYVKNKSLKSNVLYKCAAKFIVYLGPISFMSSLSFLAETGMYHVLIDRLNFFEVIFFGLVGVALGILLHEIGHAINIVANNQELLAIGYNISRVFGYNEYILDQNLSRQHKFEIAIAGVATNLLFAALLIIYAVLLDISFFIPMAIANIYLAIINLGFQKGIDGAMILENLMGIDGLVGLNPIQFIKTFNYKSINSLAKLCAFATQLFVVIISFIHIPLILIGAFLL